MPLSPRVPPPICPPAELDIPSLFIFEPPTIQDTATINLHKERVWRGRFVVPVSWIEGDLKINNEGISSSAGGQFGGGTLGRKWHGEQPSFKFDYSFAFRPDQLLLWGLRFVVPSQGQRLYYQHGSPRPSSTRKRK